MTIDERLASLRNKVEYLCNYLSARDAYEILDDLKAIEFHIQETHQD